MVDLDTCVATSRRLRAALAAAALVLGTAQAGAKGTTAAPAAKAKESTPTPAPAAAPKATPAPAAKAPAPAPAAKKDDAAAKKDDAAAKKDDAAAKKDDAVKADPGDEADEAAPAPAPAALPLKPASVEEVVMQYQRVGHELAELENRRGLELCATLRDEFRAIKLSVVIQTAEARAQTASQLTQMSTRIERLHGVEISKACQNNPLAPECL
jgi:hypothetical protein